MDPMAAYIPVQQQLLYIEEITHTNRTNPLHLSLSLSYFPVLPYYRYLLPVALSGRHM